MTISWTGWRSTGKVLTYWLKVMLRDSVVASPGCGWWTNILKLHYEAYDGECEGQMIEDIADADDFQMAGVAWLMLRSSSYVSYLLVHVSFCRKAPICQGVGESPAKRGCQELPGVASDHRALVARSAGSEPSY